MAKNCDASNGLPIPTAGVFSSPGAVLSINTEWLSVIDGLLSQMTDECFWDGDDSERHAAAQQAYELLIALADVGMF